MYHCINVFLTPTKNYFYFYTSFDRKVFNSHPAHILLYYQTHVHPQTSATVEASAAFVVEAATESASVATTSATESAHSPEASKGGHAHFVERAAPAPRH